MSASTNGDAAVEPQKLDASQQRLMRLCVKGAAADGWAPVSKPVYTLLEKLQALKLIELERVGEEGRGRARLTEQGQNIFDAMAWL